MNSPGFTHFGRYRVLGELGRGAMGVVYEAEDETLQRHVAVKTMLLSDDAEERADHEARFRQALSLAINRHDIINAEFNGQAEPAQIAPPPDSPYHHPRLMRSFTEHDPAAANRLLDQIGLTRRDEENYRTFPDGTRMTFTLNVTDYTTDGPAQFVIDDWAKVGVRAIFRSRARRLFEQ